MTVPVKARHQGQPEPWNPAQAGGKGSLGSSFCRAVVSACTACHDKAPTASSSCAAGASDDVTMADTDSRPETRAVPAESSALGARHGDSRALEALVLQLHLDFLAGTASFNRTLDAIYPQRPKVAGCEVSSARVGKPRIAVLRSRYMAP